MVKHIILWKLNDSLPTDKKEAVKSDMKQQLEALKGKIPGLLDISVQIAPLASSNADVLLDSTLEDEKALADYQTHPEHVAVADTYVRPFTEVRMCMDYWY